MADNETSNFPKMGESIIGSVVNISGQRSPYTKPTPKKNTQGGNVPGVGDKRNKGRTELSQGGASESTSPYPASGPRPSITAKICYPNSGGEAGKTQRNLKRVQGPYSFELARAMAANTKTV